MSKIATKVVARQDCDFAINSGSNNETSIKLTNEMRDIFCDDVVADGTKIPVSFTIVKGDFVRCAGYIVSQLPLGNKSNGTVYYDDVLYRDLFDKINQYFGANETATYNAELVYRTQRSSCLQGFPSSLNIRHYCVELRTELKITKKDDGSITLNLRVIKNPVQEETGRDISNSWQLITYGAPGTGKSFRTKQDTAGKSVYRTTFHPDTDYATFVGAYKPTLGEDVGETEVWKVNGQTTTLEGKHLIKRGIVYKFVAQTFAQAYVEAWSRQKSATAGHEAEKVYLVVEEINRGNCAQIFGDLFQLLDRNSKGFSEYPIRPDADFAEYLATEIQKEQATIDPARKAAINALYPEISFDVVDEVLGGRQLLLPDNLMIRATMNTSDQSLFPMDSAFKRRWDWEYVPIENKPLKAWKIELSGTEHYAWWDFLEKINAEIFKATSSEDKQLGYFFVKPPADIIDVNMFVNKVVFYLWNSVFKDCYTECEFLKDGPSYLTFTRFFKGGSPDAGPISVLMRKLGLQPLESQHQALQAPLPPIAQQGGAAQANVPTQV